MYQSHDTFTKWIDKGISLSWFRDYWKSSHQDVGIYLEFDQFLCDLNPITGVMEIRVVTKYCWRQNLLAEKEVIAGWTFRLQDLGKE